MTGHRGYVSIFYSYFAALGLDIRLEDPINFGRIDMTVLFDGQVFLFEFKVVELNPVGAALQQIKASRNVVGFEVEMIQIS